MLRAMLQCAARRPATLSLTVGLAALAGCSSDDEQPATPIEKVPGRTALCAEAVIPNGFGLAWEQLNHRISVYSVAYDPTAAMSCAGQPGAAVQAQFVGGDWTTGQWAEDVPIVRCSYAVVGAHEPSAGADPAIQLAFREVELDIDPSQSATVELPEWSLDGSFAATALAVAGLRLDTDVAQDEDYPDDYDPAHGYTCNGLAVGVQQGSPSLASVTFGLGEADRSDMNRAIPFARTKAVARYLELGVADGVLTRATHSISHDYPLAQPFDATPLPPIPPEKTQLTIQGEAGFERAAALLMGVDFDLFESRPGHGYYIRELTVRLQQVSYDPGTGTMSLHVGAYASNAGALTEGAMQVDVEVEVGLLQWTGGGSVAQLEHEASFEVGESATIGLPLEPPRPAP